MARQVFNQNLQATIGLALLRAGAGIPMTLVKTTQGARDPNDPTGNRVSNETRHSARGGISVGTRRVGTTRVEIDGAEIRLIAQSIVGIEPAVGDSIVVEGLEWRINRVESTSTAQVTWVCLCNR